GTDAGEEPAVPGSRAAPPPGTALVARIRISADAALPAARALLARRNVEGVTTVLGSDPAEPRPDFRGEIRLFLAAAADAAAVEAAARAAGEIDGVVFERMAGSVEDAAAPTSTGGGAEPAPSGGPGAGAAVSAPADAAPGALVPGALRVRHVRVDQRRLDELANGLGELAVVRARIEELVERADTPGLRELVERAGTLVEALRETALAVRMVPAGEVFDRFPRLVRDAARALGRDVEFRMEGRDVEVDRTVLDAVAEPLVHLLRNAVDHGVEPEAERRAAGKPDRGRVTLRAMRERASLRIVVEDDGAGVDAERVAARARRLGVLAPDAPTPTEPDELLRLLCRPGLSTADEVTELSGRGVGLDAVLERVRALGGALELQTAPGAGTRLSLRLPATLAVAPALRVRLGTEQYLVPMTHIEEAVELDGADVARVRGQEVLRLRGETVPLLRLVRVLGAPHAGEQAGAALVAEVGGRRRALAVDELVAREQIVMRGFDAPRGLLPHFSGVTLLADGRPALVLDPMTVF
ncbi:MAG TPA: chemotaxis protein CheW, partial [Longimicrobiales bacterium]|nr:chemotaxis protein CheW [Longimicrobiales bacterium]